MYKNKFWSRIFGHKTDAGKEGWEKYYIKRTSQFVIFNLIQFFVHLRPHSKAQRPLAQ
jgi:hypothetical protein